MDDAFFPTFRRCHEVSHAGIVTTAIVQLVDLIRMQQIRLRLRCGTKGYGIIGVRYSGDNLSAFLSGGDRLPVRPENADTQIRQVTAVEIPAAEGGVGVSLIGDFIVNDISAGEDDPLMLPVVGSLGLTYVAMHKRGNPQVMQSLTDYSDVVGDVLAYFKRFTEKALQSGINDWILDPGFGFAKTLDQNYELLRNLDRFRDSFPNRRILVGISRKSMIYKLLNTTAEDSLAGTVALNWEAMRQGAKILRVHDVHQAVQIAEIYDKGFRNL